LSYKLGELIIREEEDPRRARQHLEHALASSAAPPDSPQRAKCLAALAMCMVQEGALIEALAQAHTAIELAERLEYPDGIASACGALCNVHQARGDLASYAQIAERQVAALDQSGDLYGIYDAYHNIINLSLYRGDYELMEQSALAGLELCRKFSAPGWEGTILSGYLRLLQNQGRWDEALNHAERVLPLFERVGCKGCFMYIFWSLADIEAKRGHREQSRRYMASALDIDMQLELQQGPDPERTLRWRRFGHVIQEEWEAAWALVVESRAAGYPDFGMTSYSALWWSMMVPEAVARAGHLEEAERLAGEAMMMFQGTGVVAGISSSHFALGLIRAAQERWDESLVEFEQTLTMYRTLRHPWDSANTQYEMGLVYASRGAAGDKDNARQHMKEALAAFTTLKAQPAIDKVEAVLSRLD
jgi:tetratricopeptide (TPR) repeat protein